MKNQPTGRWARPVFDQMMHRYLLYTWILLLPALVLSGAVGAAPAGVASDTATRLLADEGKIQVTAGISYYLETSPMTHLDAQRLNPSRWTPAVQKTPNLGFSTDPVWLRFDLHNGDNADRRWFMQIKWSVLEQIEVYFFHHDTARWEGPMVSGHLVPRAQRIIDHPGYIFPLIMPAKDSATVYVRVRSNQRMVLPVILMQETLLREHTRKSIGLTGVVLGILAMMAVYNLLLFFPTKDVNFLSFSFFVTTLLLYLLTVTGLGAYYIWDETAWLKSHSMGLFSSLCFLAAAVFVRIFLRLKQHGGWMLRLSTWIIAFWLVVTGLFFITSSPMLIIAEDLGSIVSALVCIAMAVYCWRVKKDVSAMIFTIVWTLMTLSTAFLSASLLGIGGSIFTAMYVQALGFVIVVIGLSFALPERINRERQAQAEAKKRALSLSKKITEEREAKLAVQQQTLALQGSIKKDLEKRVEARASELAQAMSRLHAANENLEQLNIQDGLTKVYNRGYFDRIFAEHLRESRHGGQPMAVLMADIDHFKSVNDTHGHLVGDACLSLVARTIHEQAGPENALTARYGGEEFAVILPATSADDAHRTAEKIRMAVENLDFRNRGQHIDLRISMGVAAWMPAPGQSPEQMLQSADQALYRAKQLGRNRVETAAPQPLTKPIKLRPRTIAPAE